MRNYSIVLLSLLILGFFHVKAKASLPNQQISSLYSHLCEVNKEWLKQPFLEKYAENVQFSQDKSRIRTHLELVCEILKTRHHTSELEKNHRRHRLIEVLEDYAAAEVFPQNTFHKTRTPYFIDIFGTHCAVGYLLQQSGGEALALQIKQENNYAYLSELQEKYPQIEAWAYENGFTLEELALIQPGYPAGSAAPLVNWGNGTGKPIGAKVNVIKQYYNNDQLLVMGGNFTSMDGVAANGIIGWDGDSWVTFGQGLVGEVHDIDFQTNEKFYAVGNFTIPNQPGYSNVAFWNGTSWQGLQTGDMEGVPYCIETSFSEIIIGGDFKKFNGNSVNNLVRRYLNNWTYAPNISTNGPVYCLEKVESYLFVGGNFTEIGNASAIPSEAKPATNLAYLDYNTLHPSIANPSTGPIYAISHQNGKLYTGSVLDTLHPVISYMTAGIWNGIYGGSAVNGIPEARIHGFIRHGDDAFAYGGIENSVNGIGYYGVGLYQLYYGLGGYFTANNAVTAGASFGGDLFLAGDFTSIDGTNFPGLVKVVLSPTSAPEATNSEKLSVFKNSAGVILKNEGQALDDVQLVMYDVVGRIVANIKHISVGEDDVINIESPSLPNGLIFYQLLNRNMNLANGKFYSN